MKICLTGDWHVQSKGSNLIFVDIALNYADYLLNYCKENNIEYIFFLGDMFEKSLNIKHESFVPIFLKLNEIKKAGINIIFILGNHDIYSITNDSIVETFESIGHVIKNKELIKLYNKYFYFLSYTKNKDDIQISEGDYLITHVAIADFKFDNNYHVNENIAFSIDEFKNFDQVFSGHFHKYQNKENITYIGSPYQLTFNEENDEKGFCTLDIESGEIEFIKYNNAPKFITIDVNSFKEENVKNKFVRVNIDKKIENFIKLKHILYENGALDVTPHFLKKDDIELQELRETDFNSSVPDIIKEFIKNYEQDGISNEKLLNILEEVEKNV